MSMDVVDFNDESTKMEILVKVLGGEDGANADRLFKKTRSEKKVNGRK